MKYFGLRAMVLVSMALPVWACAQALQVYGQVDLSLSQRVDAVRRLELRSGTSFFGLRAREPLGDAVAAIVQLENRFNADTGQAAVGRPFWAGRSIVGLDGPLGRLTLGRDKKPVYIYTPDVVGDWEPDIVANNDNLINGRIGTSRYDNAVSYRWFRGGLAIGAQTALSEGAAGTDGRRAYSLGVSHVGERLKLGLGYENPSARQDRWLAFYLGYDFRHLTLEAFVGHGRSAAGHKHRAHLLSLTVPHGAGELRASCGQLADADENLVRDRQCSVGYHHWLSRRTKIYADWLSERRDNMPANLQKAGFRLGLRHNF